MAKNPIAPVLARALHDARALAISLEHEMLLPEHVLVALTEDAGVSSLLASVGADAETVRNEVLAYLASDVTPSNNQAVPSASVGLERVFSRAVAHVRASGKGHVEAADFLVALLEEEDSHAAYALLSRGVTRFRLVERVVASSDAHTAGSSSAGSGTSAPTPEYVHDLVLRAREEGFAPALARTREMDALIHVLAGSRKNSALLLGDPGVGKTTLIQGGLARALALGETHEAIRDLRIWSLDVASLHAGAQFRGQLEERLQGVLRALEADDSNVLFVDDIAGLMPGGQGKGGLDMTQLLRAAMSRGKLRVIATASFEEHRRELEKDRAFMRWFQLVELLELSHDAAREVVAARLPTLRAFHKLTLKKGVLDASVRLSKERLPERRLPDVALDVLDAAMTAVRLEARASAVRVRDVEAVIARMARVPVETATQTDRARLESLESTLKTELFGQDTAIEAVVRVLLLARAGLRSGDRPEASFLFTGPTGVGKTELARTLARTLQVPLHRFDMSEYTEPHSVARLIGAPPGYVGFDQGGQLTDAVAKSPHCVVLLDEMEKAHPQIYSLLLQVMDAGRLTDHHGKTTDFRGVILLMTSNVGARDRSRRSLGFASSGVNHGDAELEYKRVFSPEFRNRLDARIDFAPLAAEQMRSIVDKLIAEIQAQLVSKAVVLRVSDAVRDDWARRGHDPDMGARPAARLLQEELRVPLSREMLFGALSKGGNAIVELDSAGMPALTAATA